ncbi:MAG TPA: hypothetical protein GX714_14185 [Chloroflexi bacterium]|jgi:hypothetical protein|nr:hypothetical protein [Chloroflexota bacterium]
MAHDIEVVWARIGRHEGETFHQKRGQAFTYEVLGSYLVPSTTDWNLAKAEFRKALEYVPLNGPGEINHLQGPSYLYGILMDRRISNGEW